MAINQQLGRLVMTSFADTASFASIAPTSASPFDGAGKLARGLQGILGVAIILTVGGLWLAPGANWSQDLWLMKLLSSALGGMIGIALLQGFLQPGRPKVEIDTIRHEVRLVRTRGKDRYVLDRCKFTDLAKVENTGTDLTLWGANDVLIARVPASDRVSHRSLTTALRVAGKL
jgi:hypothetical protein